MKSNKKTARNYARALSELSGNDLNLQESFLNEIKNINEALNQIKEARLIFENPSISKEEKKKIIETLQRSVSTEIFNFLCILIDKQRFNILPEIQNELNKLVNKAKGIVVAEVSSAYEVDSNTIEKLKQKLENIFHKGEKILVESKIEPNLIGGIKVKINDLVYDGSIKGRLENLKRRLGWRLNQMK